MALNSTKFTSNSTRNTLPGFLVIGPQKSGTTWIYRYLLSRGDICLPDGVKETFFYDRHYRRGAGWYQKHFRPAEHHQFIAEVAPTYFQSEKATERIKETAGSIPLICTFRDPAERTFSHYLHLRRYGMTRLRFREAVQKYPEILSGSNYASHLKRWRNVFGKENVHVVFQQTLADSPARYVAEFCTRTGLVEKPAPEELNKKINAAALPKNAFLASIGQHIADAVRHAGMYGLIEWAKEKGLKDIFFGRPGEVSVEKLKTEDRQWLMEYLLPEIEDLEDLLNLDMSDWKRVEK